MGALIMTHSDDKGLVVPPRLAPDQAVIVPIYRTDEEKQGVLDAAGQVRDTLKNAGIRVFVDDRDQYKPGFKYNEWELKGVPLRLELGPRDLKEKKVMIARRDTGDKAPAPFDGLEKTVSGLLDEIQKNLFERAAAYRDAITRDVTDYEDFKKKIAGEGGFAVSNWCGEPACEEAIKDETKATIRLIPLEKGEATGACVACGKEGKHRAYFARAY